MYPGNVVPAKPDSVGNFQSKYRAPQLKMVADHMHTTVQCHQKRKSKDIRFRCGTIGVYVVPTAGVVNTNRSTSTRTNDKYSSYFLHSSVNILHQSQRFTLIKVLVLKVTLKNIYISGNQSELPTMLLTL